MFDHLMSMLIRAPHHVSVHDPVQYSTLAIKQVVQYSKYNRRQMVQKITLALDRDPLKLYLMFLSREIDIQLCQIYRKLIYIQFCIKVEGLSRSNSANRQPI